MKEFARLQGNGRFPHPWRVNLHDFAHLRIDWGVDLADETTRQGECSCSSALARVSGRFATASHEGETGIVMPAANALSLPTEFPYPWHDVGFGDART